MANCTPNDTHGKYHFLFQDMENIAPMLKTMGYDPNANPPNYGNPDKEVIKNTDEIKKNNELWEKQGEMIKKISKKENSNEEW